MLWFGERVVGERVGNKFQKMIMPTNIFHPHQTPKNGGNVF